MILKYSNLLVLLLFSLTIFLACEDEPISDPCNPEDVAGELQKAEYFASYTPEQAQTYLSLFGAPVGLLPEYTVDAYQISYSTRDKNKELTTASGVMFIPQGLDTLDLLSVQHGTVFKRDENPRVLLFTWVASQP